MQTLRVESIVKSLHIAGVTIAPTSGGGLLVTPASHLTPELRGMIRANKPELLKYFSVFAANDPNPLPEPPADPNAWRELAQAYHDHHFACQTCTASGSGHKYGPRCGVGAALWINYQAT